MTMTGLGVDFATALAAGNITDSVVVHKYGSNPAVGTAMEDIQTHGGVYTWQQAPFRVEAISTSVDDILGGDGAEIVVVQGKGLAWEPCEAEINMNGTDPSTASVQQFNRVDRAFVKRVGTYQSTTLTTTTAGTITIRISGAGAIQCQFIPEAAVNPSQSEILRFTIPPGCVGLVYKVSASAGTTKAVNVFLYQRPRADNVTNNMSPMRLLWKKSGVASSIEDTAIHPRLLDQYTDIWMTACVDLTTAKVEGSFELVYVKNETLKQWR